MCVANNCETGGVYSSMCDEDVCEIIRDPYCIVGSDGLTRSWKEKGHPRASGTFPHVITYFVKEKKILTLEEAVNKMTGRTAEYLRIKNKGLIKEAMTPTSSSSTTTSFRTPPLTATPTASPRESTPSM